MKMWTHYDVVVIEVLFLNNGQLLYIVYVFASEFCDTITRMCAFEFITVVLFFFFFFMIVYVSRTQGFKLEIISIEYRF